MSDEPVQTFRQRLELIHDFPGWVDFQGIASVSIQSATDRVLAPLATSPAELTVLVTNLLVALAIAIVVVLVLNAAFEFCWPSFRNISPQHKKLYVVANLFKSAVLALQCFSISWVWYAVQQYACTVNLLGFSYTCVWDAPGQQFCIKLTSMTYVVTDVVALVLVPKLPFSTKLHHYATSAFLAWMLLIDIAESPIAQKLLLYGFCSTLAFPVNAFLALRVMYDTSCWLKLLAQVSFVVYALCCFGNWGLHFLWLLECVMDDSLSRMQWGCNLLYLTAITALVNDDLKLLHWLRSFDPKSRGQAGQATVSQSQRENLKSKSA